MREILDDLDRWRSAGTKVALARVVDVEGSGPRGPGAAMAVNEKGEVAGSVSGGCVEGAVVTEALAILNGEAEPRHRDVRLQRRRGVRRRPHVRRHDPPVHRAAGLVSDLRAAPRPHPRPSDPVALATVIDGPTRGAKLLVAPGRAGAGIARRPRPRPRRRPRRAGRARGRPARASATTGPQGQTTPEDLEDSPIVRVFVESLRPAAADVDLRRRRLHRRAGQGRQGARLPRHGVRRPRDLRHPAPVPDGRRGRRVVAGAAVRASAARTLGHATRCASSPTTPSSTCRP